MDGHLVIGLLVFKHVLVSLIFATRFRFFRTRCVVWLCFRTVICINRYKGWNMLNLLPYLKKYNSCDVILQSNDIFDESMTMQLQSRGARTYKIKLQWAIG